MKILTCALSIFAVMSLNLALSARLATPEENKSVWQTGAAAKVVFQVVDDQGGSISNAMVQVFFVQHWNGKWEDGGGQTDSNGVLVSSGLQSSGHVIWRINKDGYYKSAGDYWIFDMPDGGLKDGKWLPYGMTNTVVLKPVRSPIPLFARSSHVSGLQFPVTNQTVGFDLKAWDWIAPYGKGRKDDLQFKLETAQGQTVPWNYHERLTITFTNSADGAYRRKKDLFSAFQSTYQVDTNALFLKEFVFEAQSSYDKAQIKTLGQDEYLIIRSRTRLDNQGHITRANYGKIYGAMGFHGGLSLNSYFNPTVNDINLEYDPKGDLFYDGNWRHRTNYAP